MCTASFYRGGGLNILPNFQKGGGVWQDLSFKREVGGREEGDLFEGRVATFTKK